MQLNKTQSFSKSINSHIVSMKLFFITHIFIDSGFASILYTFFFLFIFPSFSHTLPYFWAQLFILCFPVGTRGKESTCQYRRHKRHEFDPWVERTPWRKKWQPTLVFLPGEFHGQRSLVGNSPWGRRESDTTEQLWSTQHSTVYRVSSLCKYLIHTANQSVGLLLGHCKGSWVWQKVSPLPEIVGTQSS